jgi:hypothetical protein
MPTASKRSYDIDRPPLQRYRAGGAAGLYDEAAAVQHFDDFLGDVLADGYAQATNDDATAAIDPQLGGVVQLATADGDNDYVDLAMELNLKPNSAGFVEARLRVPTDATYRAIEFGLSDAKTESGGAAEDNGLAVTDAVAATPTAAADDCAVFHYDSDDGATWWCCAVAGGGTPLVHNAGIEPSTDWQVLRIEWNAAGDLSFYAGTNAENLTHVATFEAAVAPTAALTPWLALKAREASVAKTLDVDYLRFAFDRV